MQLTREIVIERLREVYDPEMPSINIYDLGLIYDLQVDTETGTVTVVHTLTSPMCPFADYICEEITSACLRDTGAQSVNRELTFDPLFTLEMVPEETRMIMGW